jgi:hypothetical protein
VNSLESAVAEFNDAFRHQTSAAQILLPVEAETLEAMAVVSELRGRTDIAIRLRIAAYESGPPADEDIYSTLLAGRILK